MKFNIINFNIETHTFLHVMRNLIEIVEGKIFFYPLYHRSTSKEIHISDMCTHHTSYRNIKIREKKLLQKFIHSQKCSPRKLPIA